MPDEDHEILIQMNGSIITKEVALKAIKDQTNKKEHELKPAQVELVMLKMNWLFNKNEEK